MLISSESTGMESTTFIVPGAVKPCAFICIPVEESLAERSTVIAALMDSCGVVELPAGLDVSDVLSWADSRLADTFNMTWENLSDILEVGDQLGDKDSSAFASIMAQRLDKNDWQDRQNRQSAQDTFLSLNSNTRSLVMGSLCARDRLFMREHPVVCDVLNRWPMAMQLAFVDAMVGNGDLTVCNKVSKDVVQQMLVLLSRTAPHPTGLTNLSLEQTDFESALSILPEALIHHASSLSSLHLSFQSPKALLTTASNTTQALAHLSRLTSLNLKLALRFCSVASEASHCDAMTIFQGLATSIPKLPSLTNMALQVEVLGTVVSRVVPPAGAHASKRHKTCPTQTQIHSSSAAACLNPVVEALSVASRLTSLNLHFTSATDAWLPFASCGLRGPFLHLLDLSIILGHRDVPEDSEDDLPGPAAASVSTSDLQFMLPVAPLPSLTRLRFHCLDVEHSELEGLDRVLAQSLQQQASLRALDIRVPPLSLEAARNVEASLRGALPHLEALQARVTNVGGVSYEPSGVHTLVRGFALLSSLTSLHLQVSDAHVTGGSTDGWSHEAIQDQLLAPVSALGALKDLRCHFHPFEMGSSPEDTVSPASSLIRHALPALEQLSRLELSSVESQLSSYYYSLPCEALESLPRLPQLRHLKIGGVEFASDSQVQAWLNGLLLVQMTYLELSIAPIDQDAVQCLMQDLKGAHNIHEVHLTAYEGQCYKGWRRGLAAMPSKGAFVFHNMAYSVEGEEQVLEELERAGFEIDGHDDSHVTIEWQGQT